MEHNKDLKIWVNEDGEVIAPGWDPSIESEEDYKPRGAVEDMPSEFRRMYMDYWTSVGDFLARVVEVEGVAGILLTKRTYDGYWNAVGFTKLESAFQKLSENIRLYTIPNFTPGISGPFVVCVFIPHTEKCDVFHRAMYYTHMLACRGAGKGLSFNEFRVSLSHIKRDYSASEEPRDDDPAALAAPAAPDTRLAKGIPIEKAGDMVNLFIRLCQAWGKGKDDIHRELFDIFESADLEKMRESGTIASFMADESIELYIPAERVGRLIHRYDNIYEEMYGPFGLGYEEVLSPLFTREEIAGMGCEKLLPQR